MDYNAWRSRPYNKNNYNNIYLICPEDILLYILHFELYYYVHCARVLEYRLKRNNLRQCTSIKYKLYYYNACEYTGAYYTTVSTHNNRKTVRVSYIITNGSQSTIRTSATITIWS